MVLVLAWSTRFCPYTRELRNGYPEFVVMTRFGAKPAQWCKSCRRGRQPGGHIPTLVEGQLAKWLDRINEISSHYEIYEDKNDPPSSWALLESRIRSPTSPTLGNSRNSSVTHFNIDIMRISSKLYAPASQPVCVLRSVSARPLIR